MLGVTAGEFVVSRNRLTFLVCDYDSLLLGIDGNRVCEFVATKCGAGEKPFINISCASSKVQGLISVVVFQTRDVHAPPAVCSLFEIFNTYLDDKWAIRIRKCGFCRIIPQAHLCSKELRLLVIQEPEPGKSWGCCIILITVFIVIENTLPSMRVFGNFIFLISV